MSAGLALGCASFGSIHTKADVMKFAIEISLTHKEDGVVFNKKKAKEIFDFFCDNVQLVDSDVMPTSELIDSIFDKFKGVLEEKKKAD